MNGGMVMDPERKARLETLSKFIADNQAYLTSCVFLQTRGSLGYGYSILGLVCEAHRQLTGNGRWVSSRNEPGLPDYLTEGELTDRLLPRSVVEYFEFRDKEGSFCVDELPTDVKRLMRKTAASSLYRVGLEYPKIRGKIVAEVIGAMPASLLKPERSGVPGFPTAIKFKPMTVSPVAVAPFEPPKSEFRVVPNPSGLAPDMEEDPKAMKQLLEDEDVERYFRVLRQDQEREQQK